MQTLTQKTLKQVEAFLEAPRSAGLITQGQYDEIIRRIQENDEGATVPPVRRSRRLTKRQFAELHGVSIPTVNRWLRNGWLNFERTPTAGPGYGHVRIAADEIPRRNEEGGSV